MHGCIDPVPVFLGVTRTIAAIILIAISIISICLHMLFITAIYKMSGWGSNFAFALLVAMSICSMFRYINEIACHNIALTYMDFCTHHHLFTVLGSINISTYFTVILITILMTIHRMIYTICSARASRILLPCFVKGVLVFVGAFFVGIIVVTQPNEVHFHYIPNLLSFDDPSENDWQFLQMAERITNYIFGVSSLFAYSIIFGYLFCRHSFSFRHNEIRMTVQITLSVTIQCLYFVYWEFIEKRGRTVGRLMIRNIINLAFYNSIILPYILINKSVQKRILLLLCKSLSNTHSRTFTINRITINVPAKQS